MVAHPEPATMTVEEYLALEQTSQVKHEYVHGRVYAMSGGTIVHDRIANNVRTALDNHIGEGPCMVLGPDVRLQVSETVYYYPDAMVTCDESLNLEATEIWTPRLVVEVLSDSTEANDRGAKFANFQTLDSFEEYLLVDSRRRAVEHYRRAEHGRWIYQRYGPDMSVTLETIDLTCPVATFYRGVETLAFARQLLDVHRVRARPAAGVPARPRAVPTLHRVPAIGSSDDLRAALFGTEESVGD